MESSSAKICVPVCVSRISELSVAVEGAAAVADIVELRLDYLEAGERQHLKSCLLNVLKTCPRPLILTLRSRGQGGHSEFDLDERRRLWASLQTVGPRCFFDLELDLVRDLGARQGQGESVNWSNVICSFHNFAETPADLEAVYDRMAATPARILKLAVRAKDATDCLSMFRLLGRAKRDERELIAISMDRPGIMTRVLGPSRGSFLTYGSIEEHRANAPGQLSAAELDQVFRIHKINCETEIMGLVGNPVAHSLSPHIHNAAFAAGQLNAVYLPFETTDAASFIRRLAHPHSREFEWNLRGLSVTAPHKSAVINHLDWIEPTAREIGAVNTILVRREKLYGYNTDAAGFIEPLRRWFGSLRNARCAVVGAGGGARAALWALKNESAEVALFVRDPESGSALAREFKVNSYSLSSASFDGYDIVINATPLGTRRVSENDTASTAEQFRGVRLAYDLVYNPLETRFLREARAAGCHALGGIEMLLAQAVEQFKLWTGKDPDLGSMRAAALNELD